MTKPRYLQTEQATPTTYPASGDQGLFFDSADGRLKRIDASGAVVDIESSGGGGGTSIDSGTSWPVSPDSGDYFFRTDMGVLGRYDGATWDYLDINATTTPTAAAVPQADGAGVIASGWIPDLSPSKIDDSGASEGDVITLSSGVPAWGAPGGYLERGSSFPSSPAAGDIFYRTDLREMAYYDGTRWVGNPFLLPMANYNAFAQNVSSNVTLYSAALPTFSVLVESLLISWACNSADASNYWTVDFYQGDSSGITLMSSTVLNATWTNFTQTVVTSFTDNPIAASKNNVFPYVSKTGAPDPVSLMMSLFVRRVF